MKKRAPGLIETMRVIDGHVPLWPLHLDRLHRSAAALGILVPELERPGGGADRVVRLEVSEGEVSWSERPLGATEPIALVMSPAPHRGYPHKRTDRAWLDACGMAARGSGADDALLLDVGEVVVEATIWAIGWWRGERLVFPPLALGGLPSVARARLAEVVRGGLATAQLHRGEAYGAPLVACNAARGLVPVAALDGVAIPANQRTAVVARRFWDRDHA